MSDSSSATGHSTAGSASSQRVQKTKFERDVEAAQRRGVSSCKNMSHWGVKRVGDDAGGKTWTDAEIKHPRAILNMMSPGKPKCTCEKMACRWAWDNNWNHKGMFQTMYVPAGVEAMGIGEVSAGFPAKKIFPVQYSLSQEQFGRLNSRFPDWYFVSDGTTAHDHPIAHISTNICTKRTLEKLRVGTVLEPTIYFDLHGSPAANEAFMRRTPGIEIVTFVELITPKDYVRKATKWGPQFDPATKRERWSTTHIRDIPRDYPDLGKHVSGFISTHTTYYYDAQEIANLLAWAPQALYYGIMHKFDGAAGDLNFKEQTWVKRATTGRVNHIITQTNVKTGEAYEHPDNSWWFNSDAWCTDTEGFGWTSGMLCDDTYFIIAAYCPPVACKMSTKCVQIKALIPDEVKHCSGSAMTQADILSSGKVRCNIYGATYVMDIHPRLVNVFGDLRASVVNKPRTVTNFADHTNRAKLARKSVMSDGVDMDAQQLSDIARISFFIDFEDEFGFNAEIFNKSYYNTLQADRFYRTGAGYLSTGTMSALTDMVMAAADAKNVKTGVMKAARAGVLHMNRAGVLKTL